MKLEDLIKETLKHGIPVVGVELAPKDGKGFAYEIDGFSKSGTAKVYQNEEGIIICKTRYDQYDMIETFGDLAAIAFEWNAEYCDREPFGWDSNWLPVFEKYGWVKVHEKIVKDIEINK